jgi:hypothetical protein
VTTAGNLTLDGSIRPAIYPQATQSSTSFAGDGTSGIYLWGAQFEIGALASSQMETVATTVTRQAATASIPANGASGIKITYSNGETATLSFNGASSLQVPAATKAWGSRYITLIEYLP